MLGVCELYVIYSGPGGLSRRTDWQDLGTGSGGSCSGSGGVFGNVCVRGTTGFSSSKSPETSVCLCKYSHVVGAVQSWKSEAHAASALQRVQQALSRSQSKFGMTTLRLRTTVTQPPR